MSNESEPSDSLLS